MLRIITFLCLAFSVIATTGTTVLAASSKSIFQLDTGGHMAIIRDVIFMRDGRRLLSASDDKTVRIWDLVTGKTIRTIRGESGEGNPGKNFAMAVSPDERLLAIGGWLGGKRSERYGVRIHDLATGRLITLMTGHNNVVFNLAFSSDGRHLVSGGGDGDAIIWDVKSFRMKYRLKGHRDKIFAVAFSPDGSRVVTGAWDNDVRLWDARTGRQIRHMKGHRNKVQTVTYTPDGNILTGDWSGEIRMWNGRTGAFLKTFIKQTSVGRFSVSQNGRYLLVGNGYHGRYQTNVYDIYSGRKITSYYAHQNNVIAVDISPDNRWAATSANNEIHIWNLQTGKLKKKYNGRPLMLKGIGSRIWNVGFSSDGRKFGWGYTWKKNDALIRGPLEYSFPVPSFRSIETRVSRLSKARERTYRRATDRALGVSITRRKGGQFGYDAILDIKRYGQVLSSIERGSSSGYVHYSYTVTPNGRTIISGGGNGRLTAYSNSGRKLGEFVGHEGVVWSVAVSPDGRFLVSGSSDQTVRLWNIKTRKLLVTLFHSKKGEWVMWTPEGFFMGSENGGKLVGWQINQGVLRAARYVKADQLRDIFYRPDLVAAKIAGDPGGKLRAAVQEFDVQRILRSGPAPEINILTPGDSWETDDNKAVIKIDLKNKGGGIGQILWKVNGQLRAKTRGLTGRNTIEVALGRATNKIEVVAYNKAGLVESKPAVVSIKVQKKKITGKPDLYVLAVGADDYYDSRLQLQYAVKDATRLVRVLEEAATSRSGKSFYRNVKVKTLTNAEVTRENLAAAFNEMGRTMRSIDVFVFFIAGHGKTEGGDYFFIPPSFRNVGKNPISTQGFGPKDWEQWTTNIKADKSLMMFDTCEAGSIARIVGRGAEQMTAYERLKDRTGRMIVMATNHREVALEGYKEKHGVLTYATLEAIALADRNKDKQIMLTELVGYVSDRVPQMSCELTQEDGKKCYRQVPQASFTGDVFPLIPAFEGAHPERRNGGSALKIGDAYPGESTHATLSETDLLDAPNGSSKRKLPGFYGVKPVKEEQGFTLVARDGKIIGYLPTSSIRQVR